MDTKRDSCFYLKHRTGCLVIGYVNLVINITFLLLWIAISAESGVIIAKETDNGMNQRDTDIITLVMTVICLASVILIINLSFSIVLLVGLHKNKRGHVNAYLILSAILIAINFITFLFNASQKHVDSIIDTFKLLYSSYFYYVIRSYYLKMNEPAKNDAKIPAVYYTA